MSRYQYVGGCRRRDEWLLLPLVFGRLFSCQIYIESAGALTSAPVVAAGPHPRITNSSSLISSSSFLCPLLSLFTNIISTTSTRLRSGSPADENSIDIISFYLRPLGKYINTVAGYTHTSRCRLYLYIVGYSETPATWGEEPSPALN